MESKHQKAGLCFLPNEIWDKIIESLVFPRAVMQNNNPNFYVEFQDWNILGFDIFNELRLICRKITKTINTILFRNISIAFEESVGYVKFFGGRFGRSKMPKFCTSLSNITPNIFQYVQQLVFYEDSGYNDPSILPSPDQIKAEWFYSLKIVTLSLPYRDASQLEALGDFLKSLRNPIEIYIVAMRSADQKFTDILELLNVYKETVGIHDIFLPEFGQNFYKVEVLAKLKNLKYLKIRDGQEKYTPAMKNNTHSVQFLNSLIHLESFELTCPTLAELIDVFYLPPAVQKLCIYPLYLQKLSPTMSITNSLTSLHLVAYSYKKCYSKPIIPSLVFPFSNLETLEITYSIDQLQMVLEEEQHYTNHLVFFDLITWIITGSPRLGKLCIKGGKFNEICQIAKLASTVKAFTYIPERIESNFLGLEMIDTLVKLFPHLEVLESWIAFPINWRSLLNQVAYEWPQTFIKLRSLYDSAVVQGTPNLSNVFQSTLFEPLWFTDGKYAVGRCLKQIWTYNYRDQALEEMTVMSEIDIGWVRTMIKEFNFPN